MGWSRTKSLSTELPHKPSMMLWFMTGAFMAVVGALLFIIRASEYVKALNDFSIWWLALTPPGGWFFLFCLRHWQWSNQMDEHLFLKKEGSMLRNSGNPGPKGILLLLPVVFICLIK